MRSVQVLLADDHPLIIEGLTTALARHHIKVVGQATTTGEVLAKYAECQPDVLVLDVRFGEVTTGLDVAREALRQHPDARIVFYSQFDQDEIVFEAYRVGGAAFVTKNTAPAALAEAIQQANDGRIHFQPGIAERVALIGVRAPPLSKLDARELEVFEQMARGRTNVEIAESMSLSPKTISMTSQSIKDKLGVQRPAEITLLWHASHSSAPKEQTPSRAERSCRRFSR